MVKFALVTRFGMDTGRVVKIVDIMPEDLQTMPGHLHAVEIPADKNVQVGWVWRDGVFSQS